MRDGLHHLQADQFVRQQAQRPALAAGRRVGAGNGNQVALRGPIQHPLIHPIRALARQCGLQPLLNTLATDASDGSRVHLQGPGNRGIRPRRPAPPSPWSALSRMRARVSIRAGAMPAPTSVRNWARSASDSSTAYLVLRMRGLQTRTVGLSRIAYRSRHHPVIQL
jgi:hypothetical protein